MALSVHARIFLLTIVPVVLFAFPVLLYLPQESGQAARTGLEGKLTSLSRLLGHTLAPELEREAGTVDAAGIGDATGGLGDDSDVARVSVYGAEGGFLGGLRVDAGSAPVVKGAISAEADQALSEEGDALRLVTRIRARALPGKGPGRTLGFLAIEARLDRVRAVESAQRRDALGVGGVALVLGIILALVLGARISKSLTEASEVAAEVGRGNLGLSLPDAQGSDELSTMLRSLKDMVLGLRVLEAQAQAMARCDLRGSTEGEGDLQRAFAQVVVQQRQLVHELSETATELETSSHEILATLRDQEAGANEQASAVEEARRTMLSLLQASSKIASAAKAVHANAQATKESSAETAERTGQLNQLTARIADVLTGITKIADRSDILALNAALEGTKAGEAGKGFILVAEEMRRLAENVLESVRDISELVEAIREASQASVLATEQGVKLSLETADSANQIRLTSQQQQSGTEMATQSMNEISQILTQALGGARQTTSAVEELSQRASRLRETLSEYVLEDGSSA